MYSVVTVQYPVWWLTPLPPHTVTDPITEGILEPLINLLLSSDVDVQKSSSLAISNIALHGPREWMDYGSSHTGGSSVAL